jgi:imidazolonepropionase
MTKPAIDLLLKGASLVLTCSSVQSDLIGRRQGVAVAIQGETIVAVASLDELEASFDLTNARTLDLAGKILAPGFIDCHTHLVFGGSRAQEYAARMTHSAAEIAGLGIPAGIQATVRMTRASQPGILLENAAQRVKHMLHQGTTTVESKSGYGLTLQKELELLGVNRELQMIQPVDIISTFLGAHDFPPELPRSAYLDLLINEMIPQVADAKLAEFCDVYCDEGYYTVAESRLILETGFRHGLRPKIHLDAYSDIGGSGMAADLQVVSADHLNFTPVAGIEQLASAGVIGVIMPGLDFAVRHPHPFNARVMLDLGLPLALATDDCPACWLESMQLVIQLACRQYQVSPEEALLAATRNSALALGLTDRGTLEAGKLADIQVWDLPSFEDLVYRLGNNAVSMVIKRGRIVFSQESPND